MVHRVGRLAQHPMDRDAVVAAGRIHREDRLERGHLHRVDPDGPRDRVSAEPVDEVGPAHDDPGLRAAEQLVARAEHEPGPVGEGVGHARLVWRHAVAVRQQSGAHVVQERHAALVGERGQILRARFGREADHAVVRRMHLQDRAGAFGGRGAVIADARAVRGADLDELGARGTHDVGDPELAADLDQLATGDEHLLALRERSERPHERGRAVVHDEGVLGAGERDQHLLGAAAALPALARLAVDLEVGVGGGRPGGGTRRVHGQGRAPEIRVEYHPGRVDHGREAGGDARGSLAGAGQDVIGGGRFGAAGRGRAHLAEGQRDAALQ